ncbi:hypothetical protein KC364_g24 [Hortaea werneckii]|nr:hypothetical protein KC364_g24 [Hortaea werneckii]
MPVPLERLPARITRPPLLAATSIIKPSGFIPLIAHDGGTSEHRQEQLPQPLVVAHHAMESRQTQWQQVMRPKVSTKQTLCNSGSSDMSSPQLSS